MGLLPIWIYSQGRKVFPGGGTGPNMTQRLVVLSMGLLQPTLSNCHRASKIASELGGAGARSETKRSERKSKMQQAQPSAVAVAPSPAAAPQHDSAGGDAPPKQVAQAMERLGRAGRLIADIRLGADRLLEALFVAVGAPAYSAHQHAERTARAFEHEEAAMHRHFQDLRALGRYLALESPPCHPRSPLGRKLCMVLGKLCCYVGFH